MGSEIKSKRVRGLLKASTVMGSASLIAIIAGVIKGKVAALILGPAGVGLIAMFQSVMNTSAAFAGMGLATSGVQQIASSNKDGLSHQVAYTRTALYYSSCLFGLLGAAILILLRKPIGNAVFGDLTNVNSIALLSIGVWATIYSGAQTALLNGLHRINDLARVNILSAIGSVIISVIAIWQWRDKGVILVVMSMPAASLAASWWISREVAFPGVPFRWENINRPLRKLLSLGFVFMSTSLMTVGAHFLIRVIITQRLGIDTTGQYQAAWSISMLYLGFVLTAMGADYYPRISAIADDTKAVRTLVNDQAEIAILLTGPVIIGMISLSPLVIQLLYSSAFTDSTAILRWQLLGDLFKVVSWSMGFILLRERYGRIFFFSECAFNIIYVGIIWFGVNIWGPEITGFAFFIAYLFHFFLIWLIVKHLINFYWNREVLYKFMLMVACAGVAFYITRLHEELIFISYLIAFLASIYAIRKILSLSDGSILLKKIFNLS